MARSVALLELKTYARQLSDTENDPNVTDSELRALANRHICEVYDRLVDAGPADYYASTATVTTVAGTIAYDLEDDFRSLVGVYVREGTHERRLLYPMPEGARGRYRAPSGVWTLDVEYIPTPTPLSGDDDEFDGVSGWDELIVNLMARDVMAKRESDPSVVMSNIARLEARIVARSRSRDKGQPKYVTDVDDSYDAPYPYGWTGSSRLACYRLRADKIELYEALTVLP